VRLFAWRRAGCHCGAPTLLLLLVLLLLFVLLLLLFLLSPLFSALLS